MVDKLYDATRAYNGSLRWGDWDRAAEHLPTASADAFIEAHQEVGERLVVIDYEMTRLEIDKLNGIATSQAAISWHTNDNLVVRETVVDHLWQWHEGRWVLVDERRSGGKPLAIFAEVDTGQHHPWLPGLESYRDEYGIGLPPEEKRKRERARKRAERDAGTGQGEKWSLDELKSMPTQQRPPSFN